MGRSKAKYNMLLLLAAMIWGFAFVAQSEGVKYVGPFTLNGVRFGLGSLCILPVVLFSKKNAMPAKEKLKNACIPGLITGIALFAGVFQQTSGVAYTTVGKAAFITGLYIVFVPVAGIFLKHASGIKVWLSTAIAAAGLYLLCIQGDFTIAQGDALVLASAVIFTAHILLVDRFSKSSDVFAFAFAQSAVCSILSLVAAFIFEDVRLESIMLAGLPILYGSVFSVGIGFTLQVIGQKYAKPSHAALIMSMEAVFAALAGWIVLSERMAVREYIGCVLMLCGMIITQLPNRKKASAEQYNERSTSN